MQINVNTGELLIDVVNEKGRKIGEFYFIPTDTDIIKRANAAIEALNQMNLPKDPSADEIVKLSEDIKGQFNMLLNKPDAAEGVFKECSPLTVNGNGDYFFESVMEGIAGLVESTMKVRLEKKLEKVRKATAKYHT